MVGLGSELVTIQEEGSNVGDVRIELTSGFVSKMQGLRDRCGDVSIEAFGSGDGTYSLTVTCSGSGKPAYSGQGSDLQALCSQAESHFGL